MQGFPEVDIQSLKEAVQLSRQEAVEALRHTKGNVEKAFVNELAAMHLDVPLVDDLVLAYAAHRCTLLFAIPSTRPLWHTSRSCFEVSRSLPYPENLWFVNRQVSDQVCCDCCYVGNGFKGDGTWHLTMQRPSANGFQCGEQPNSINRCTAAPGSQ